MTLPEPQNAVDTAVLNDLAAGKIEALEALYDQFAGCLYGLAVRICGDETRAGGVVEQVFTEIWNQRERGIAFTAFVPRLLARCRELALGARASSPAAVIPTSATAGTGSSAREGSQLLDRIPADARAALEIAYFEGLPVDAIAARIGATRSQVLEHLRVSLDELRPLLGRGAAPGIRS